MRPRAMNDDSVYCQKETSPDGKFLVAYTFVDGEKTPLINEPRVRLAATGEILVDLWKGYLTGSVYGFTADGFQLKVTDHHGPGEVVAFVDEPSRTFRLEGDPTPPRPLAALPETVYSIIHRARENWRASFPPPLPPPPEEPSLLKQFARWLSS